MPPGSSAPFLMLSQRPFTALFWLDCIDRTIAVVSSSSSVEFRVVAIQRSLLYSIQLYLFGYSKTAPPYP